ncbi:MAG: hypothetical protein AAFN51_04440 [Pseudomonadota bacterium]
MPSKKTARPWTRRELIQNLAYGAAGLGIIGGGGYYFVSGVRASIVEGDLSKIGNGIPTIVQVHDPGCPKCRSLQRSTRNALAEMEEGEVQYLVANIKGPEGRQFADAHGVGHVTLVLFDGEGRRRDVIRGEQHSAYLLQIFRRLSATRS